MKDECGIVQDLIPLVTDGVASDASKRFVREHCQNCAQCSKLLGKQEDMPVINSKKINQKLIHKVRFSLIAGILLMTMMAATFTGTMQQFQNFLLIPTIGIVGSWLLHRQIYLLYILLPCIHVLIDLFTHELGRSILPYTLIYWVLLTVGIVIYQLYAFAFRRDEG